MTRETRSRRRSSGRAAAHVGGISQLKQLARRTNPYRPIEVLSAEQVELIHEASLRILEEVGMDFLHPEALEILARGGAEVEPGGERVRFDRALLEELVAKAPARFTCTRATRRATWRWAAATSPSAWSPARPTSRHRTAGGGSGNFRTTATSCAWPRPSTSSISSPAIRWSRSICRRRPATWTPSRIASTLTDKVIYGYSLGRTRIRDAGDGAHRPRHRRPNGGQAQHLSVVNTSSPLRLDGPMIEGIIEMAAAQPAGGRDPLHAEPGPWRRPPSQAPWPSRTPRRWPPSR